MSDFIWSDIQAGENTAQPEGTETKKKKKRWMVSSDLIEIISYDELRAR